MLLFIFQYGRKTDKLARNMFLHRLTYLEYAICLDMLLILIYYITFFFKQGDLPKLTIHIFLENKIIFVSV